METVDWFPVDERADVGHTSEGWFWRCNFGAACPSEVGPYASADDAKQAVVEHHTYWNRDVEDKYGK